MPRLNPCFHKHRVQSYQVAIDALLKELGKKYVSYERRVEFERLRDKLKIEQVRFINKFGVETKGLE